MAKDDNYSDERIISGKKASEDAQFDSSLRPKQFQDYIGQEQIKYNLEIFIQAANERNEALDHVLLYGPPGLGKTTLAHIIAEQMETNIHVTSGPAIERPGDLAAILTNLEERDILFIDEIHRLHRSVEEILYPAMEDYSIDIMVGKGPSARSLRLDLASFTLVGATTRAGSISSPLRDRFGVVHRLEFYKEAELCQIIKRSATILGIEITAEGAEVLAKSSRGTPRVANRLLKRARDFAQVKADNEITEDVAKQALNMLQVDSYGLDEIDRHILSTIYEKFGGGPVGIDSIAAAISEESETIEDVYEPYLLQLGFLHRTPKGRVLSSAGKNYLGYPDEDSGPDHLQQRLF